VRFTADYLQKEISCIVTAPVTWHKVTKVIALPHGQSTLIGSAVGASSCFSLPNLSANFYNQLNA